MTKRQRPIVAIDGPAGAGKSTVSRKVAQTLGYTHVDTGALYRTVALAATRAGIGFDEDDRLRDLLPTLDIRLMTQGTDSKVFLGEEDVSEAIRTPPISMGASTVSAREPVRQGLLDLQRKLGGDGGSVLEGRDIGTVVFPDAEVKVFLDANPQERAKRRFADAQAKGIETTLEATLEAVIARDRQDSQRALAPLKPAPDAAKVDSTQLSIEEVVEKIAELARAAEGALA